MKKIVTLVAVATLGVMGFTQGSASAAITTVLDSNNNGIVDVVLIDRWHDGGNDIFVYDENENGMLDYATVDLNNDEWYEIAMQDINENGIFDVYSWDMDFVEGWENTALDLNENGVVDGLETDISWTTAPTPVTFTTVGSMGDYLGTAGDMLSPWFGSPDFDGDGTFDYNDWFPGDSDCNSATDAC